MKTTHNQDKKGFTIIEVVLVLAIAGLIFLIVFLAVPALQRSQRDTQRRNDLGRFMSQISNYQSNNNGQVPSSSAQLGTFVTSYLSEVDGADDQFKDPVTGETYTVSWNGTATPETNQISYRVDATCDGGAFGDADGNRTVAAMIGLEGGGSFCQDNR